MTPSRTSAYTQTIAEAEEGTVFNRIYKNNMDDESYMGTIKGMKEILRTNKELTMFSSIEAMHYYSHDKCELKIVWKNPGVFFESIAFAKNSSLRPFFELAYRYARESGILNKFLTKWASSAPPKCYSKEPFSLSMKKVISLVVFLGAAICAVFLILITEIIAYQLKTEKSQNFHKHNVTWMG